MVLVYLWYFRQNSFFRSNSLWNEAHTHTLSEVTPCTFGSFSSIYQKHKQKRSRISKFYVKLSLKQPDDDDDGRIGSQIKPASIWHLQLHRSFKYHTFIPNHYSLQILSINSLVTSSQILVYQPCHRRQQSLAFKMDSTLVTCTLFVSGWLATIVIIVRGINIECNATTGNALVVVQACHSQTESVQPATSGSGKLTNRDVLGVWN